MAFNPIDALITAGGAVGGALANLVAPGAGIPIVAGTIAGKAAYDKDEAHKEALAAGSPAPAAASGGPAGLAPVPSSPAAGGLTAGPAKPPLPGGAAGPGQLPGGGAPDVGLNPVSSEPLAGSAAADAKPDDTLGASSATAKPIDWGGAMKSFGDNIQKMNHGGYNTIFGSTPPSSVAPVQAPKMGMAPATINVQPFAPPPQVPLVASDARLKRNVLTAQKQLHDFLNALYRY